MNGHWNLQLQCEELERRELLSGNTWNSHYRESDRGDNRSTAAERSKPEPAMQDSFAPGSNVTATLQDPNSAATGRATYQSTESPKVNSRVFRVAIQAAAANSSFDVVVDGRVVGQLTTDANGNGMFSLASRSSSSSARAAQDSPAQPPEVHPGSTISVGPLSGTFVSEERTEN